MLDKTKRYLVVGLGLLGGKYALELTKAGFHVDGINRSEGHLQYALDHGYIASGKTYDFEDLVRGADHIIFGLYPTALLEWFKTYGQLIKPGCLKMGNPDWDCPFILKIMRFLRLCTVSSTIWCKFGVFVYFQSFFTNEVHPVL